jgi:hypothetical protein
MRVPFQAPAPLHVAVVLPQPEIQRAREGRDERDVGERTADEVVTALRRPVDDVMQTGRDQHARRLRPPSAGCEPLQVSADRARVDVPRIGAKDGTEDADGDHAGENEDGNHGRSMPDAVHSHKS